MKTSTAPATTAKAAETITVTSRRVGCDGGAAASQGALGHPLVYITMDNDGTADCPYCGRHFVLAAGADTGH